MGRVKYSADVNIILFLPGSGAEYCYDTFHANRRTKEQEEKRKEVLATASGALDFGKQLSGYRNMHID